MNVKQMMLQTIAHAHDPLKCTTKVCFECTLIKTIEDDILRGEL